MAEYPRAPVEVDPTVVGLLSAHAAETVAVHGIADTSRLITIDNIGTYAPIPDVSGQIATHSADTTDVHGIADASRLITIDNIGTYAPAPNLSGYVQTTDPRLSDSRAPTAHIHPIADITALQTALDAKVGTGTNGSLTGLMFTGASPSIDSTSTFKDLNFKSNGVLTLRVLRASSFTDNVDSAFFQFGQTVTTEKGVITAGSGNPLQRFSVVATGMFVGAPAQNSSAHGSVPPPAAALHVQNYTPSQYGALVRHAPSPTTDYFRVEHADTTAKMRLDQFGGFHVPSGGSEFGGASLGSTTLSVRPTATNQRALALQMLTGQATDMFAVLDPSNNKQLSIDQFGQLVLGNNAGAFTTNGSLTASTVLAGGRSGAVNMTVKAQVGQSVNLEEWQDSAGLPLSVMTASGGFSAKRGFFSNDTVPASVTLTASKVAGQSGDVFRVTNESGLNFLKVQPTGQTVLGDAVATVTGTPLTVYTTGIAFEAISTAAIGAGSGSGIVGKTNSDPTLGGQRLGYFLTGVGGSAGNPANAAGMVGYSEAAWSGTSRSGRLEFETTPIGSVTRAARMRIRGAGQMELLPADAAAPTPTSGVALYVDATGLRAKGSNGTDTLIAAL